MKKKITVIVCLFFVLTLVFPLQVAAQQKAVFSGKDTDQDRRNALSVQEKQRVAPSAPKITFYTKKITPTTKKINIKMTKTVKNMTYVLCRYSSGKKTGYILNRQVKQGNVSLRVNLKKLRKGDKIEISAYTLWNKANGEKMMRKKYGTSKVFVVR